MLAEATLTVVLFADASRIDMRTLRQEYAVPARLLGIGLPLTIALGALLAAVFFGGLSVPEALVLAVVLAPTDAALGQAVVTEPRLPSRIRQGLNVESGLNDGICVRFCSSCSPSPRRMRKRWVGHTLSGSWSRRSGTASSAASSPGLWLQQR